MFKHVLGLGKSGLLPPRAHFKSFRNKTAANGVQAGACPEPAPETTFVTANESAEALLKNSKVLQDEHEVNSARKEKRRLEAEHCDTVPHMPSLSAVIADNQEKDSRQAKRQKRGAVSSRKPSSRKVPSRRRVVDDVSDLIGKVVQVPGVVFLVDVPGLYYVADVKKKERRRKGAVEVVFRDDNSRYWFPAADVRAWMQDQMHRGVSVTNTKEEGEPSAIGTGNKLVSKKVQRKDQEAIRSLDDAADEFAAEVLTEISTGGGSAGQHSTEQAMKEEGERRRGKPALGSKRKRASRFQVASSS